MVGNYDKILINIMIYINNIYLNLRLISELIHKKNYKIIKTFKTRFLVQDF
jgi:hypothetical protein